MAQVLKNEIKSAIFISAKKEFMQHGYEKSSMRKIAAGAGVTSGNLYRYFENKESIYRELLREVVSEIDSVLFNSSDGLISFKVVLEEKLIRRDSSEREEMTIRIIEGFSQFIPDLMENKKEEILILLKTADQLDIYNDFNLVQWIADMFKIVYNLEHASYHVAYGLCKSLESIVEMGLSSEETRRRAQECIEFMTKKR
jgi:AcrR family transcriptional regulator